MKNEPFRDKLIRQYQVDCRHFNGIQNKCCKAGVNYEALTGDTLSLPCKKNFVHLNRDPALCDKFSAMNLEEATARTDERLRLMDRTMDACSAAHDDATAKGLKKGKGGVSSMPCPTKCGGSLSYSVASVNGHMHARCDTKGCVSWME